MTQGSITTSTLRFQRMGKLPVESGINSFCPTGSLDRVAESGELPSPSPRASGTKYCTKLESEHFKAQGKFKGRLPNSANP